MEVNQISDIRLGPAQRSGSTSEFGRINSSENHPARVVRQRSVSGPNSPGEVSLLKRKPEWMGSPKTKIPVLINCLYSVDEVVATPSFNVNVIESACDKDFKFFDVINNSKYVAFIDGAMASLGLFAVSIGIYVVKYCKLREIERNSHYFYFNRIFNTCVDEEIKNRMGEIEQGGHDFEDPITYEHLRTAAYFYPPDISKIACWRRRFFSSGKKREQLKVLNKFLKKYSKEETLDKLHKQILSQICQLLNREAKLENFQIKGEENNWRIGLTDKYAKDFFDDIKNLIENNSKNILEENKNKKNFNFIPPILAALGQASFIYWILMFIFYFIPVAPVVTVAAISVIPLGIALGIALPLLITIKIINTYQTYKSNKGIKKDTIESQHKQMIEKKLIKLNKQKIFLDCMTNKNVGSLVNLKDSLLMKDLKRVVKNRHFIKYYAICMGFLDGCFLPLFASWLLLDGTKVILTYALCPAAIPLVGFTPIGLIATAIIAGVTLLIGISYGIYSAYKAKQAHEAKFDDLKFKIDGLEKEIPDKQILNKSLRDYDRLLRRFTDELPIWTNIKKGLNRLLVVIKRLGTGSLVFRLVVWGPTTAIYAAVVTSSAGLACFPIILIIGTALGAFVLASWYLFSYNLESKTIKAGNIVEHLVQSEQLAWIDTKLPRPETSLSLHDSSEVGTLPTQAEVEADIQRDNRDPSPNRLFQTQREEDNNKSMEGVDLRSAVFSC